MQLIIIELIQRKHSKADKSTLADENAEMKMCASNKGHTPGARGQPRGHLFPADGHNGHALTNGRVCHFVLRNVCTNYTLQGNSSDSLSIQSNKYLLFVFKCRTFNIDF